MHREAAVRFQAVEVQHFRPLAVGGSAWIGPHGGVEAMWTLADRLQSLAPQPQGGVALGCGFRAGTGPAGWGAVVPAAPQPVTWLHRSQGHQLQAADVTGNNT